jgi:hypothetical protein
MNPRVFPKEHTIEPPQVHRTGAYRGQGQAARVD